MKGLAWKGLSVGATILGGIVANKVITAGWKFVTGQDSPENADDPELDLVEAVSFALVSGAIVGLARMYSSRQAIGVWQKATGELPPPMQATAKAK